MLWRRKQDDEDPFASLRDGSAGTRTAPSAHTDASSPRTLSGVPGADGEPSTSRMPGSVAPKSRRGADRFLVALLVLLSLGASAALLVREERDADRADAAGSPANASPTPSDGDATPGDATPGDRTPQKPLSPREHDLVRPAGMRLAVRALRRTMRRGETLDSLRVASDRINAIVHGRNGRQRQINIADDLAVDVTESGQRSGRGMRLALVDAGAPWRATRTAARRSGVATRRIDYLVLSAPIIAGASVTWSLFIRDVPARNTHWVASRDGRVVYRPGEQPGSGTAGQLGLSTGSSTVRITRNGRRTVLTGAEAQRVIECVQRAGNDGAAIQRCLP